MRPGTEGLGCEQVVALSDPTIGLAGFVVIDNTTRGPATGGIRFFAYRSEADALEDGFRLARAMTLKNAAAELPAGGGKIVLIEQASSDKAQVMGAVGRVLQSLGGRFLAGRDVGIDLDSARLIRAETDYMVDESDEGLGDLNRHTALGVLEGAAAARDHAGIGPDWRGVRVAIQGVGGVGSWLAVELVSRGAHLILADTRADRLQALRATLDFESVSAEEVLFTECDVLAPCAVGGVIRQETVERLRARAVAGSANNILADPRAGELLFERGIVYAPDFLINAGAVIAGTHFLRYRERRDEIAATAIGSRTRGLLDRAQRQNTPPERLLAREALDRLKGDPGFRQWFWPG